MVETLRTALDVEDKMLPNFPHKTWIYPRGDTTTQRPVAKVISEKTKEKYSKVMCHIQTRLRFALLRATLVAVRGYRGKKTQMSAEKDEDKIDFNLIPEEMVYKTY